MRCESCQTEWLPPQEHCPRCHSGSVAFAVPAVAPPPPCMAVAPPIFLRSADDISVESVPQLEYATALISQKHLFGQMAAVCLLAALISGVCAATCRIMGWPLLFTLLAGLAMLLLVESFWLLLAPASLVKYYVYCITMLLVGCTGLLLTLPDGPQRILAAIAGINALVTAALHLRKMQDWRHVIPVQLHPDILMQLLAFVNYLKLCRRGSDSRVIVLYTPTLTTEACWKIALGRQYHFLVNQNANTVNIVAGTEFSLTLGKRRPLSNYYTVSLTMKEKVIRGKIHRREYERYREWEASAGPRTSPSAPA